MQNPPSPLRFVLAASVAVALAVLTAVPALADFTGQTWRLYRPIALPERLAQDSLVELVPDGKVFAGTATGLRDLRIVDEATRQETPYKLLVEKGERRRSSIPAAIRDLGSIPGQSTSFVADLGREGTLHNQLEIRTPSRNFQRRVIVEGSSDVQTWATLDETNKIFDFTIAERNLNERLTLLQYPSSSVRYLRVRIINDNEAPLDIAGAIAYFDQELPPVETALEAAATRREEKAREKKTEIVVDLGSQGLPTNRLSIETSQENFYREASVDGSADAKTWVRLQSSEVLYAFNTPRFVGSKLSVRYPESTFRYIRLTVLNGDDQPLPVSGIRAYGYLRRLVFSASPGKDYRLYYGNPDAEAPSYELERIFPYLVTENLPRAQLGTESVNPLFSIPAEPPEPFTERYPWLLPAVVAVSGLLIGLFLARLLRQVKRTLPPPGQTPPGQ